MFVGVLGIEALQITSQYQVSTKHAGWDGWSFLSRQVSRLLCRAIFEVTEAYVAHDKVLHGRTAATTTSVVHCKRAG